MTRRNTSRPLRRRLVLNRIVARSPQLDEKYSKRTPNRMGSKVGKCLRCRCRRPMGVSVI